MKAVDPVCGMGVSLQGTPKCLEYRDQTYYFCTAACQKAFDIHPEKYVSLSFPHSGIGDYEHKAHS